MKYFHIAFNTPFGPGTYFYRGDNHPFMPKEYDERTEKIASNLSIQYAKNISPTAIIYTSVIELPLEVAKARWPEDFMENHPNLCKAGCGSVTVDVSGTCPWCKDKGVKALPDNYQSC
jgi:hypothetical protein